MLSEAFFNIYCSNYIRRCSYLSFETVSWVRRDAYIDLWPSTSFMCVCLNCFTIACWRFSYDIIDYFRIIFYCTAYFLFFYIVSSFIFDCSFILLHYKIREDIKSPRTSLDLSFIYFIRLSCLSLSYFSSFYLKSCSRFYSEVLSDFMLSCID
jgi:hypothetical protein